MPTEIDDDAPAAWPRSRRAAAALAALRTAGHPVPAPTTVRFTATHEHIAVVASGTRAHAVAKLRRSPGITPANEAAATTYAQRALAPSATVLVPRVLIHDNDLLALEFAADDPATPAPTAYLAALPELVTALARVHTAPGPPAGRPFEPLLLHVAARHPDCVPPGPAAELAAGLLIDPTTGPGLRSLACGWTVDSWGHNDLRLSNIVLGQRTWLLDWEHAGPSSAAWDVACLVGGAALLLLAHGPADAARVDAFDDALALAVDTYQSARTAAAVDARLVASLAGVWLLQLLVDHMSSGPVSPDTAADLRGLGTALLAGAA